MSKIVAYCGNICNDCPVLIATMANDMEMKRNLAKEYSKEDYVLNPEDINCYGCTITDKNQLFKFCMECEIRLCGLGREVENCGHCNDYPCDKLNKPFEMSAKSKETLDQINKDLKHSCNT
ncbi:DUF3795 domain-containing protein, partial [Alkaliphilus serpentinus]